MTDLPLLLDLLVGVLTAAALLAVYLMAASTATTTVRPMSAA